MAFLLALWLAAFLAWLVDLPNWGFGWQMTGAVTAGLGAGMFLGALS